MRLWGRGIAQFGVLGAVVAAIVAGCGSNSGVSIPPAVATAAPGATATAPPIPQQTPFAASAAQAVVVQTAPPGGTPPPLPATLPTAGGYSGAATIPLPASVPAGTVVAQAVANTSPQTAGGVAVPLLQSAFRAAQSASRSELAAGISVLVYDTLSFNSTLTLPQPPSFAFGVPGNTVLPNTAYYLALFDPLRPGLGWQLGFEGPGAVSVSSPCAIAGASAVAPPCILLAPGASAGPFSFVAFIPELIALYAVTSAAPPPTPAPSVAPSVPTPNPAVTTTPFPTPNPTATPT